MISLYKDPVFLTRKYPRRRPHSQTSDPIQRKIRALLNQPAVAMGMLMPVARAI